MYVGRIDELGAGLDEAEPPIERLLERGNDLETLGRQAAVRHAQTDLGRAVSRRDDETGVLEQRLEVDVPDPRDVLPVRDRVVERDDQDGGTPISSVRTTSFAPAGFLTSRRTTDFPPAGIRSKRPNAALKRESPVRTSSSGAPTASDSAAAATAL